MDGCKCSAAAQYHVIPLATIAAALLPRYRGRRCCPFAPLPRRWIEVRVGHRGGTAVAYRADCRVSGVALMERVATILEGALAAAATLGIPAMQMMAFEVIERLQGASLAGGAERDVVEWLQQSARQYQRCPPIALSSSSRLSLHQEVSILYGHRQPVTCTCVVQDLVFLAHQL